MNDEHMETPMSSALKPVADQNRVCAAEAVLETEGFSVIIARCSQTEGQHLDRHETTVVHHRAQSGKGFRVESGKLLGVGEPTDLAVTYRWMGGFRP